ncbi:MAG: hypothetical protein DYG89_34040 [Caldilinea sp. CFX5]|nr:hypothetical protein [Caldilinea sp. CFX5]
MLQTDSIGTLDVSSLADRCASETAKFLQRVASDTQYCYELFRRALVLQNQEAYNRLVETYIRLVRPQVRKKLHTPFNDQDLEDCVNWAFANCFRYLRTAENFAKFPTLQHIIGYLLACANATAQSHNRRQAARPVEIDQDLTDQDEGTTAVDPLARLIEEEDKARFYKLVRASCKNEQEQVVLEYYLELGLMPREIYAQRPDLFTDVKQVHRVKQILIERLQRLFRQYKKEDFQ